MLQEGCADCRTAYKCESFRNLQLIMWFAGVRSARLLTWQERLAALRDLLLWDHALWLGLHIYTTPAKVTADGLAAAYGIETLLVTSSQLAWFLMHSAAVVAEQHSCRHHNLARVLPRFWRP